MNTNERARREALTARRRQKAGKALDGGLESAVQRAGGELLGFSVKIGELDYLMTLRARFPAGRRVSFVGADSLVHLVPKVMVLAGNDELKWKEDKFAKTHV